MGGNSVGMSSFDGEIMRFDGVIDTNGGGFSLVEAETLGDGATLADALAGADYLRLRVRSANGRGYELIVDDEVTRSRSQIMHFAPIEVSGDGLWEEILVPLSGFDARAFGTPISDSEPFRLAGVTSVGVILADGVDGPFSLEVDRIDTCVG